MAWVSYKGLDLVTDENSVEILAGNERVYFKRFGAEIEGMQGDALENWLLRAAVVKADEHLSGGIVDDTALEPWS